MSAIVTYPHIAHDARRFDGWPYIKGTRVRVVDVASWYEAGLTADQIAEQFSTAPQAAIFAALAYYCDHREEIKAQMTGLDRDWKSASRRSNLPRKLARAKQRRKAQ